MKPEEIKKLNVGTQIFILTNRRIKGLVVVAVFEDFLIARSAVDENFLFKYTEVNEKFFITRYDAFWNYCAVRAGKVEEFYTGNATFELDSDFDMHKILSTIIHSDISLIADKLEFCKSKLPMRTGRVSLNKCRICPELRNLIEVPEHYQFYRDRPDEPSVSMRMKSFQTDALKNKGNTPYVVK